MKNTYQIADRVCDAKGDIKKADSLIRDYMPFIRSEAAKFTGRLCTQEDDEMSIAMIAFHQAIQSYVKERGPFLGYASLVIRSRLTDWHRKESRHKGRISIYEETVGDDSRPLYEQLADSRDHHEESASLQATKQEIAELAAVMAKYGVTFADVAANSPRQERTLETCRRVIQYAVQNPHILDKLLQTGKLPLSRLAEGTAADKKTLERHRKYIVAMLLIQTNGYEIIRGHLRCILGPKGGVSA